MDDLKYESMQDNEAALETSSDPCDNHQKLKEILDRVPDVKNTPNFSNLMTNLHTESVQRFPSLH
jgi:hypothetical protein